MTNWLMWLGLINAAGEADPQLAHILDLAANDSPTVRVKAIGELRNHVAGSLGAPRAVVGALGDPDRGVRLAAAQVVINEFGPNLIPYLDRVLLHLDDTRIEVAREISVVPELVRRRFPNEWRRLWDERAAELRDADDATLRRLFEKRVRRSEELGDPVRFRNLILTEVLRRRTVDWAPLLGDRLAEGKADDPIAELTVLRRLQAGNEPFVIEWEATTMECIHPQLPIVRATLINQDCIAVPYVIGGRRLNWHVQVRTADGRIVSAKPLPNNVRPGLSSLETIAPGEKVHADLPLSSFVETLAPGRYTLIVMHHEHGDIADGAAEGMILNRSSPIELTVRPAGGK